MDKNTKEQDMVELNQKDLEEVSGGTFTLNYYWKSEYEEAGIKVVTHLIEKDEFFALGTTIDSYDSRYWGTVNETQIVGRLYPIF